MPTWRMMVNGTPQGRPHYGDTPDNVIQSNSASYMPAQPATPEQMTGGYVRVRGHRGMISLGADPQMANYLPSVQVPSRWAPAVQGNVLVSVLTDNMPPCGPMNPSTRPIHVPVPASPPAGLSTTLQVNRAEAGHHGYRQKFGYANPAVTVTPQFYLRGSAVTS